MVSREALTAKPRGWIVTGFVGVVALSLLERALTSSTWIDMLVATLLAILVAGGAAVMAWGCLVVVDAHGVRMRGLRPRTVPWARVVDMSRDSLGNITLREDSGGSWIIWEFAYDTEVVASWWRASRSADNASGQDRSDNHEA